VPLTPFQRELLAELAKGQTGDRYLAGGAALHFEPDSTRYSHDLDFFHDAVERVASTFTADRTRLETAGYDVSVELSQPGLVRAVVSRAQDATRVDWAHDSAWRFLPLRRDPLGGLLLDPVELAVNKVLALAGRDEPRDYVDTLFVHERVAGRAGGDGEGAAADDGGVGAGGVGGGGIRLGGVAGGHEGGFRRAGHGGEEEERGQAGTTMGHGVPDAARLIER